MGRQKQNLSKKPCKVEGCRYYGKPMFFLGQHMENHRKNKDMNNIHSQCSIPGAMKGIKKKKWDNTRKAEKCMHPDCPNKGVIYTRLGRHITRMHKISRYQYDDLIQMVKKQHVHYRKFGHLMPNSTATDFCPAIEEKHPGINKDDGNDEFLNIFRIAPKVQVSTLVPDFGLSEQVGKDIHTKNIKKIPDNRVRLTKRFGRGRQHVSKEVVNYEHKEGFQIILRCKKTLLSSDHKRAFFRSLEWPDNNGTIMLQKTCEARDRVSSFTTLQRALSTEAEGNVRYLCFICKEYHCLNLVAGTSVLEL